MRRFQISNMEQEIEPENKTVVLSGPLSEAYTQALNLVFAKTTENKQTDGELTPGVESMANDFIMKQATGIISDAEQDQSIKDLYIDVGTGIDAISDDGNFDDNKRVDTIVLTPTSSGALQPDTIASALTHLDAGDSEIVVALDTSDLTLNKPMVMGDNKLTGISAIESLYARAGVTVVRGLEGLVTHLVKKSKKSKS